MSERLVLPVCTAHIVSRDEKSFLLKPCGKPVVGMSGKDFVCEEHALEFVPVLISTASQAVTVTLPDPVPVGLEITLKQTSYAPIVLTKTGPTTWKLPGDEKP